MIELIGSLIFTTTVMLLAILLVQFLCKNTIKSKETLIGLQQNYLKYRIEETKEGNLVVEYISRISGEWYRYEKPFKTLHEAELWIKSHSLISDYIENKRKEL